MFFEIASTTIIVNVTRKNYAVAPCTTWSLASQDGVTSHWVQELPREGDLSHIATKPNNELKMNSADPRSTTDSTVIPTPMLLGLISFTDLLAPTDIASTSELVGSHKSTPATTTTTPTSTDLPASLHDSVSWSGYKTSSARQSRSTMVLQAQALAQEILHTVRATHGSMDQMAAYFPVTMGKVGLLWLEGLALYSIGNWQDQFEAFIDNFQVIYTRPEN